MNERIKCIIKRPDEPVGHESYIRNALEAFQMTVGGYIETLPCGEAVIIVNEEGKLMDLPANFAYTNVTRDLICGTVVVVGIDGEDFTDVPFGIGTWANYLWKWGNAV